MKMQKVKNEKNYLLICYLSAVIFFFLSASAFAQERHVQERIVDNAGLLDSQEKASLTEFIASVASNYNFDLVIVTEKSIGGMAIDEYAVNYFKNNGYGSGQNRDGCILLQVTEDRDYWFEPSGRGIRILNSTAFNKLEADAVNYLRDDNYYEAYRAYVLDWQEFLVLEAKGRNYNFFHQWNVVLVIIAWLFALVIGCIVVLTWKNGMNTALGQTQAAAYAVPGSLMYNQKKDTFLGSKVSKTQRQSSASGSGSSLRSGGGSRGRGGRY